MLVEERREALRERLREAWAGEPGSYKLKGMKLPQHSFVCVDLFPKLAEWLKDAEVEDGGWEDAEELCGGFRLYPVRRAAGPTSCRLS